MAAALALAFFGLAALGLLSMLRVVGRIGKPDETVQTGGGAATYVVISLLYGFVYVTAGVLLL